jgi:molybdopterin-guanine dinucleotide biosynthesis protein A
MARMRSDHPTVAVILAGGQGRRFGGGNKSFIRLAGRPLIAHVIERIAPQVAAVLVGASGDAIRFQPFGLTVVPDDVPPSPATGPLVGLTSTFSALRRLGDLRSAVLSVPVDTPFLPTDLVPRLAAALARDAAPVAFAATATRDHPIVALWSPDVREAAYAVFAQQPEISLHGIMEQLHGTRVVFGEDQPIDAFFNVNTPADLETAERIMSRSG